MASASTQPAALSAEQAKVVLAEVIQAFSAPENAVRMDEARDNACNDMGKMLQFVLPVATQIQQEVIKAYGFSCDGEGGSDAGRRELGRERAPDLWAHERLSPFSPHGGSHNLTNILGTQSPGSTLSLCVRVAFCTVEVLYPLPEMVGTGSVSGFFRFRNIYIYMDILGDGT
ncbi:C12orf57 isoform 6 [Pan troglodytes]|uniref:Protein C10 n=1 Tax=Pan troglodytes TaxID=9598 RepID=A0A2J8JEH4_PANTR|nr:C12orf57 isoform 6 [Pan troglodytes]